MSFNSAVLLLFFFSPLRTAPDFRCQASLHRRRLTLNQRDVGASPMAVNGQPTAVPRPLAVCGGPSVPEVGGAIRTLTLFFLFLLWHPLSDVWWLPTNRHRLHTNRHRLPTNCHRLSTNRHRLPSYTPTAIGYPPTAIGYTPTAIGYPPTAIGYTPTAIGYTPMAIGYPPTAIGYPPAAIVGRIGHSEFVFFSITAPPDRRPAVFFPFSP